MVTQRTVKRATAGLVGSCMVLSGLAIVAGQAISVAGPAVPVVTAAAPPPPPSDGQGSGRWNADNQEPVEGAALRVGVSEAVTRQIREDAFTRDLLAGRPYETRREGPWQNTDGTREIGVVRELLFRVPQDFSQREWPSIRFNDNDQYTQHEASASYENVLVLTVFVDTRRGVVAVVPDGTSIDAGGQD